MSYVNLAIELRRRWKQKCDALIAERDELGQQRGELEARVVELQEALRDIEAATTYSPCRDLNAWDDALAKLIQHHARLLPPATTHE